MSLPGFRRLERGLLGVVYLLPLRLRFVRTLFIGVPFWVSKSVCNNYDIERAKPMMAV